jgi:hypothetical protein
MTRAYGASDDLLEFEGDVQGEVGCFGTDDREHGVLAICSDGTLFEAKYGKGDAGIWGIQLLQQGSLFDRIEPCADEDATIYSDQIFFKDGLKFAFAATEWERVK